jgi:glycosyltransferase involved in cell wall biosynthesis
MKARIYAFFQNMPPAPSAASLRGQSIIQALVNLRPDLEIKFFTSTPKPQIIIGAKGTALKVSETQNSSNLFKRLVGEVRIGYVAVCKIFLNNPHPDLVIISSPSYIAAIILATFSRLFRVPFVLELRDIYPQVYSEANLIKNDSILYRVLRKLSNTMYHHASLVLCATEGLAREVLKEEPGVRIRHVYNGFPNYLLNRPEHKHQKFTICFHGILGYFQDIASLISVAKKLLDHNIDVIVIGYGRKADLLLSCGLSNLHYLGKLTHKDTIIEIERCHLSLCLRHNDQISKDAFPVKVWECLALGIPTIITPPCEAGNFLTRNNCGYVLEAGDIDRIVNTILYVKDNPNHLSLLSYNCRKSATPYTRENTGKIAAEYVLQVLESLPAK